MLLFVVNLKRERQTLVLSLPRRSETPSASSAPSHNLSLVRCITPNLSKRSNVPARMMWGRGSMSLAMPQPKRSGPGALRDRLGELEDQFFSTVFLGSSLLFLAMLFTLAAAVGAMILSFGQGAADVPDSMAFHFSRTFAYNIVNIYMVKMAGVFLMSTSTVVIFTKIAPRWVALVGFGLALILLFVSSHFSWTFVAFPLWVLLMSICLLIDEFSQKPRTDRPH
jgi:hypothetical protein